jgi:hypothetical protein
LAAAADNRAHIHNFVDEPSGFAGLACWPVEQMIGCVVALLRYQSGIP